MRKLSAINKGHVFLEKEWFRGWKPECTRSQNNESQRTIWGEWTEFSLSKWQREHLCFRTAVEHQSLSISLLRKNHRIFPGFSHHWMLHVWKARNLFSSEEFKFFIVSGTSRLVYRKIWFWRQDFGQQVNVVMEWDLTVKHRNTGNSAWGRWQVIVVTGWTVENYVFQR